MANLENRSPRRTGNTTTRKRSTVSQSRRTGRSGATSRTASRTSSRGGRSGKRNRKPNYDITQILMYVIGALIVILCIALVVRGCSRMTGTNAESTEASESSVDESTGAADVTVDGVDISGMSQEEAQTAILQKYNWNMKVKYQDKEIAVNNLMEAKVKELLDELYAGDLKAGETYEVKTENMIEAAKAEAALISGTWNMVAKNGGISGYNKETNEFTFTEGSNGLVIDQDKLAEGMVAAIENKEFDTVLTAEVREVSPELTAAQLRSMYKTIGTFTTKTTSNSNRNENIRLSCNAINGTIVNPGREFSFNDTTGPRSTEKGYKPATAYLNGEVVQEPGGGVCQISSTLYNAVIFAGLKSTERHAHSYEPSYVTPGDDAAVSFGGPDFKFVNNSDYPIAIRTSFANQELKIWIYGVPVLEEGEKIRMVSEKTADIDPPAPVYEEDQTLQLDEELTVKQASIGSRWTTYLVATKDGTEVSREFLHNSSYRGKAAIIKRNTSGVVVTTAAETTESLESLPVGESQPVESGEVIGNEGPGVEGPGGEIPSTEAVSPGGNPIQSPGSDGVQNPGGPSPTPAPTNPIVDVGPAGPGN